MKRIFLLLLVLCGYAAADEKSPSPSKVPDNAETSFVNALEALKKVYRAQIAKEIENADRIILFRFSSEPDGVKDGRFTQVFDPIDDESTEEWFISPSKDRSHKIDGKVEISAEQRKMVAPKLQTMLAVEWGPMPRCHTPHHGIRAYDGERLIFEADICLHCDGYCLHFPDTGCWSRFMLPEDTLQPILSELLPLPKRPKGAEDDPFDLAD